MPSSGCRRLAGGHVHDTSTTRPRHAQTRPPHESQRRAVSSRERALARGCPAWLVMRGGGGCRGEAGTEPMTRVCPRCVPQAHFKSGWVLSQVGRAHYEMVRYSDALRAFKKAHDVEPHRLAGMELHSTILWHLKREVGRSPGRGAHPPTGSDGERRLNRWTSATSPSAPSSRTAPRDYPR